MPTMDDSASQNADANTPKAPKDKNCPFCGQAFTSSSLGRHLDLYIKERNPKPADGVHDVDSIRKMRGNITRRQPRGSIGGRRDASRTPTTTPRASISKRTPSHDDDGVKSSIPKDGQYVVDSQVGKFPFLPRWETTGVINDIPGKHGWDAEGSQEHPAKRPAPHRSVSKQILQKTQFDAKQQLADAMDTARAAELALREFISSWRSAKQQIDNTSSPFDFDPLSYDFPALTLQCLKPPPTLFSSTQHPTSTSWSVQVPGKREFDALKSYFEKEFRSWKLTCATATTAVTEELVYPPNVTAPRRDVREAVKLAEQSTDNLEKQVGEHLQSAYAAWESLPTPRRNELWLLELARAVGRKQKESDSLKHEQHRLKQENTNLRAQIDQLNMLQQPREFKLLPPQTFPVDRDLLAVAFERGVKANETVGFDIEDRHEDLSSLISKVIGRWKDVITSTRVSSSGMGAQRPLDQTAETPSTTTMKSPVQRIAPAAARSTRPRKPAPAPAPVHPEPQVQASEASETSQASQASQEDRPESAAGMTEENSEQEETSPGDTAPPSVADTSDQDADAEMEDDDSFAIMNTSPMKTGHIAMQPQAQLDIPRTRGQTQQHQQQQQQHQQQHQQNAEMHYMMQNGAGSPVGRQGVAMTRSMPNINMALQGGTLQDMSMSMQDVGGDPMYME